ncbi:prepilin-type N-terminal cleavage/methylation domain-containing protein [Geovibrio thiophilus]|uniref:Prepilin-type N-terminal cleavage/methylation domain-containing protein n=1 Tax=Geovibrio thiophilus TaxID=139438 RepID=A0A410K1C9_9BACT|nr:prepilin-type N-terminal cleavage/methylation domain-containing protein [Geovibrio thiophilus]QAR34247.1 prepilin-type N-terminal cleavage/methylation domain-containing protein [Geovibrio thiophilus]
MRKGFTLLELLIAMVVLSIGMMGIFTLVRQSLDMNDYAKRKLDLLGRGYERVILTLAEGTTLEDIITDNGTTYTYKLEKQDTGLQGIKECELRITDGTAEMALFYYER